MRGAWRFAIAALTAGLWLAPSAAPAQDATPPATSAPAEAVGPRELQNFNLSGNVTRAADQRPARIEGFDVYAEATGGRGVSTRLELTAPGDGAARRPWALRSSDVDLHGHVNNAVHWQAVEDGLRDSSVDAYLPLVAELDYRDPIDLADDVELLVGGDAQALCVGFRVGEAMRAVARVAAGRPPGSR